MGEQVAAVCGQSAISNFSPSMTWHAILPGYPGTRVLLKKKIKKKRVFACGEAASQTEVPVRRSRAGTESDHNYANTTSFQGGSIFSAIILTAQLVRGHNQF